MDGEYRESVRIHRLERQVANLAARVRTLEAEAGIKPVFVEAVSTDTDEPARPAPLAPPPAPMSPPLPQHDPVAAAWANTARTYGTPRAASTAGAIPGWGTSPTAPAAPAAPATSWDPTPTAAPATSWDPAPTAPTGPGFSFDLRDLEERFAGRAMAWIGGAALIGAAVFFLSLAFSRGWIGEELRVAIGLAAGTAALVGGALLFDRRSPMFGNVLVAVGLGIVSIALFAATRGYGLVAPEFGLAGAFLAAAAAAVIAIRYDAKEVAAFGLLAALAAPPVMDAPANLLTLLFVAVILVGTTAIALFRTWPYLPAIAFILAAPQLASYLSGGVGAVEGLIALVGFWVVNVTAAAGEEWRIRRDSLKPSSATLVLANATFALWGGYTVLTGAAEAHWLGTYVGVLSVVHLLLGGWFLRRQGLSHLFGNLVAGTGIALVAIAAFVQLGAPVVPLAWAAEATALAWLAVRRMHKWSALAAVALGGLAVAHIVIVEYPLYALRDVAYPAVPWLHAQGASVLSVVAALALAALFVPVRWIRSALIGLGVLLVEYAALFEVPGPAFAATLVVVAIAGVVLERVIAARGTKPQLAAVGAWSRAFPFAAVAAAIAGAHAVSFVVGVEFPLQAAANDSIAYPEIPWLHPAGVSAILVVAGLGLAALLLPIRWIRSVLAAIAILLVEYVAVFEVKGPALTSSIVVVALVALVLERLITARGTNRRYTSVGAWSTTFPYTAWAAVIAGIHAVAFVAVMEFPRWQFGTAPAAPYATTGTFSLLFLLAGLVAAGRLLPDRGVRSLLGGVAVLVVGWTLCTQLGGLALFAALAALLPLAVVLERGLAQFADDPDVTPFRLPKAAGLLAAGAGVVTWLAACWLATLDYVPPMLSGRQGIPGTPFIDETAQAALALIAAVLAAARWTQFRQWRTAFMLGAVVVGACVVPLEVYADLIVPIWIVLAGLAMVLARRRDRIRGVALGVAGTLGAGAALLAFGVVAPPERLWVDGGNGWLPQPLLIAWPLALGSITAALALAGRLGILGRRAPWLTVGAAATFTYLASVGVVDVFQRQVGQATAIEELAIQAQVAMSVCWTIIGVASLAWGLARGPALARHVGLGLLGIATLKVFVVDLASMDVAYRAVVLAGLGVLLMVAAGLYTRLRGPRTGRGEMPGEGPAN